MHVSALTVGGDAWAVQGVYRGCTGLHPRDECTNRDASKIPVDEIEEEWRSRSSKGRYEHAMWTAAGLEEPQSRWEKKEGLEPTWAGEDDGARAFEGDEAMDNLRAHPQWQR